MNTRQKGDYAEVVVLAAMLEKEKRVAIPYGNSQGFDLLVLGSEGHWKTIQVKTAYRRGKRGNRIYVDTMRGTGASGIRCRGYLPGSFDLLVAVLPKDNLFWVIPFKEMEGRRCLTLPAERPPGWELI